MLDLRWYVARAGAMSLPELAWRTGSGLRLRHLDRRDTSGPPARFDDPEWREALLVLMEREREAIGDAAQRIASGELAFWGKRVEMNPSRPTWNVDPLTGESWEGKAWRGKGRDPKPALELHRQQHAVPLAAGAALFDRRDWARLVVEQTLDWVERNPPRHGMGWVSGYEAAHRLVAWAFALPLVAEHAAEAELEHLGRAVAEHRAFVASRPSRFSSANNHRLAELVGLLAGSFVTPGRPDWVALWEELEREAVLQTYGDGGSREQASAYFLYVLEILWVAGLLGRAAGRELGRLDERLRAMLAWLGAVGGEDGELPLVGDDAEDRLVRLDFFEPRRARTIARRVADLIGVSPPAPTTSSVLLAESGYAVLRSGPVRVVFDVGELGFGTLAAHGHADALSVLVDRGTNTLLRDSGTGSYVHDRDDDRATAFHNTVTVDGKSQARPLGPHLWGRRYSVRIEAASLAPELDYVRASHDGYRDVQHTRSVMCLGGRLMIVFDRVEASRPVRADLTWQPGPALENGPAVASDPPVAREELPGRFSPRYTSTESARRFVWPAHGTDVVFATAVPLGERDLPSIRLERTADGVAVEVNGVRVVEDWSSPVPEVMS